MFETRDVIYNNKRCAIVSDRELIVLAETLSLENLELGRLQVDHTEFGLNDTRWLAVFLHLQQ